MRRVAGYAVAALLTMGISVGGLPGGERAIWTARYDGSVETYDRDFATSLALSPDGRTVYVTGQSNEATPYSDYLTIAYQASTGQQLWASTYDTGANHDVPWAISVSPDGARVFVTGQGTTAALETNYATVALEAESGVQLWASQYDGPGTAGTDIAYDMTVSFDGSSVFVTGENNGTNTGQDFATVAYDAFSGAQLWEARYDGQGQYSSDDYSPKVGISPDGTRVFVTGTSGGVSSSDMATVAYDATSGTTQWVRRYDADDQTDFASGLQISLDSSHVYVTGLSVVRATDSDFLTVSYRVEDGQEAWVNRYSTPGNRAEVPSELAQTPDGRRLFVSGFGGSGDFTQPQYLTVALDARSGTTIWADLFGGELSDIVYAIGTSPDGKRVYVSGSSNSVSQTFDYLTVAYSASAGERLWVESYDGPAHFTELVTDLAVDPRGRRVYVTGMSNESANGDDYLTVAYRAR